MNKVRLLSLFIGLAFGFSCTEPNNIGLEIQPPSDVIIINSTDFNSFMSITESEDSVKSDEPLSLLLGEITDPIFSYNQGSFLTQILLSENNISLGSNPQVDSVILSFTYSGYYGDLVNFTNLEVIQLPEDIYQDSVYYSNSFSLTPGSANWVDSYTLSNDSTNPFFRIRLTNDFGQQILNLGEASLQDNETFLQEFKGIGVSASALNTILYLNANGSDSYLKLYYHNDDSENDTLSIDFEFGGDAACLNLFNTKEDINIISDSTRTYIQSMAGYKSKISIMDKDSLQALLTGKAINKVLIHFNVENGSQDQYAAHEKLFLVRLDQEGTTLFLRDFIAEGEAHFGGFLADDKYEFNITRYFHEFINDDSYTNDLYLLPAGGAVNANRTILDKNISLVIHYSEL